MKIKGAIFDMDGTLVDSLMFWNIMWGEIGKVFLDNPNFKPSETVDKQVRTMILSDVADHIVKACNLPIDQTAFLKFLRDRIEVFYRHDVKAKTGAVELLEALKEKGIPLCLASASGMHDLKIALESCGLTDYFDVVLSCADIGVGKDKPDIYKLALDRMGLSAEEVCVFEDSFVALETAEALGCQTVGVFDQYNFEQERLKAASDIYVDEQDSLFSLIPQITRG